MALQDQADGHDGHGSCRYAAWQPHITAVAILQLVHKTAGLIFGPAVQISALYDPKSSKRGAAYQS